MARATVLLPNQFELGLLAGCPMQTPMAVSREQLTRAQHPVIDYRLSGTGDAFSAAWLALYLCTQSLHLSLTYAGEFLYRVVRRTAQQRQRELQLLPELPWLQQTVMRLEQEST